jgi:hypothetical protein
VHEPETAADDPGAPEYPADTGGLGIGYDVEVLGSPTKKQVADGATHQIGLMAVLAETLEDSQSVRIDAGAVNTVFRLSVYNGLGHRPALF